MFLPEGLLLLGLNIVHLGRELSSSIRKRNDRINSKSNYSGLLATCGGSLMLVVSAGCAAAGGTARTHYKTSANCCRVPIYRARAVRSLARRDLSSYL